MIKAHRIGAFLLRHWYEVLASIDRKVDMFFWPTIDMLAFGLLTVYIEKTNVQPGLTEAILGCLILWSLVYSIQRDITISLLDDAWSRNLYNLLSSPLSLAEIMIGSVALSFLKAILTISLLLLLSWGLFGFNLLAIGFPVAFFVLNIFMFGWAFGYVTTFLVLRFGTKVQAVAWSLLALLYPVSGVLYPLNTLPDFLADIAKIFPISYIFESLRLIVIGGASPDTKTMLITFGLNLIYIILGMLLYRKGYKHAKARGWFIHPS